MTLDDDQKWREAWSFKDHGKSYELAFETEHPYGFRWLHSDFGTNWRMTEIQAVTGLYQLERLAESVATRNRNARIWREHLGHLDALRVPEVDGDDLHAYYKFYCYMRPEALDEGWSRDRIQQTIEEAGVPVTAGSCSEIYLEDAFVRSGLAPDQRLPVAKELGETSLMFQVHPGLSEETLHEAGGIVSQIVSGATR